MLLVGDLDVVVDVSCCFVRAAVSSALVFPVFSSMDLGLLCLFGWLLLVCSLLFLFIVLLGVDDCADDYVTFACCLYIVRVVVVPVCEFASCCLFAQW